MVPSSPAPKLPELFGLLCLWEAVLEPGLGLENDPDEQKAHGCALLEPGSSL